MVGGAGAGNARRPLAFLLRVFYYRDARSPRAAPLHLPDNPGGRPASVYLEFFIFMPPFRFVFIAAEASPAETRGSRVCSVRSFCVTPPARTRAENRGAPSPQLPLPKVSTAIRPRPQGPLRKGVGGRVSCVLSCGWFLGLEVTRVRFLVRCVDWGLIHAWLRGGVSRGRTAGRPLRRRHTFGRVAIVSCASVHTPA